MNKRERSMWVAEKLYGIPYRWGGDDPMAGFDCSGYVIEVLQSSGVLPHEGDWTANDLFLRFRNVRRDSPHTGYLVFYGTASKVTHVELCLDEQVSIGASGGGSRTIDDESAIDANAFIKVRPIRRRSDIVGYVDPFADEEEEQ